METVNENLAPETQESKEQKNDDFDYDEFGRYLDDIETQLSPWHVLEELDGTVDQVEDELDSYNSEIMSSDKETKRKMAVVAIESYNLNLLARDEDFNVRTLALCNKAISPSILEQTVEDAGSDDKFTLMVIANNPSASSSTLSRIFDLAGDEREVQTAILGNPNCDDVLKFKVDSLRARASVNAKNIDIFDKLRSFP